MRLKFTRAPRHPFRFESMPFDLQLSGRIALVTGGSRGLGLALAQACAGQGMRVAICARHAQPLEAAARALREQGAECVAIAADLADPDAGRQVVEATVEAFGGVDLLVNNASSSVAGAASSVLGLTEAHLVERFMGKTMAAIRCARAAVPVMRARGGGRIVCIGGTSARTVFREGDSSARTSTLPQGLGNSGVANFCKYLADEVAPDRITVNVVHPHSIYTERIRDRVRHAGLDEAEAMARITARIPIGRLIVPDDVVGLVLFLASPWASAITGQAIAVDGGAVRNIMY